ncbi:MAG TPA: HAD family hydrolase [Bellilinea sp.]|nr:HAD family hydrolase [Bellilinea sp.]
MALDLDRIAAICFDVDGTLSDTDDLYMHRLQRMLNPLRGVLPGRQTRRTARWLVMGLETPGNWAYGLLDRLHLDDEAGLAIDFFSRNSRGINRLLMVIPGVSFMLAALHAKYPLAVVSARGEHSTHRFLEGQNLLPFFGPIATALTTRYTKPFPDPVLWAAWQMNVPVERCLMVGDTTVDILAGKAAGAQTVGVLCGFGSERELRRAGADLILPTTAQLDEILLGGN